jgi:hypothetical protein
MPGRKSKYTPELIKVLLDAVGTGMTDGDACLIAGISEETFYAWQRTKPDFSDRILRARPNGWKSALERIRLAGIEGDWKADAEYLDRTRSPYRKSQEMQHTGPNGAPLTISFAERPDGPK